MSGAARILRTEIRRGPATVLAIAVAATGTVLLFVHPDSWAGRWLGLAVYLRTSLILLVPLVAAVSCWQAGRERRRGVGELLASTSRPGWQPLAAGWAASTVAALAGLAATLAVGALFVGPQASYAGGGWAWVGAGAILPLAAVVALGFAVGRAVPSRLIGLPLAVALYVLTALPGYARDAGSQWLTPYVDGWFTGSRLTASTHLLQALWFAGLALALLALAALAARPAARRGLAAVVAVASVLAAAAATTLVTGPGSDRWRPDPAARRMVCTPDRPQICLTRPNAFLLNDVAAALQPPLPRLAGIPGAPVRAVDQAGDGPVPDDAIDLNDLPASVDGRLDLGTGFGNPLRDAISARLAWWNCGTNGLWTTHPTDREQAEGDAATEIVTTWVLGPPAVSSGSGASSAAGTASADEVTTGLDALTAMPAPTRRAWIGAYLTARAHCDNQALATLLARVGA